MAVIRINGVTRCPSIKDRPPTLLDGYTTIEASNGVEALKTIDKSVGQKIDLLLTDVIMPEMNGVDLSAKLLDKYPELKVLYISGIAFPPLAKGIHFAFIPLTWIRRPQLTRVCTLWQQSRLHPVYFFLLIKGQNHHLQNLSNIRP